MVSPARFSRGMNRFELVLGFFLRALFAVPCFVLFVVLSVGFKCVAVLARLLSLLFLQCEFAMQLSSSTLGKNSGSRGPRC